MLARTVNDAAAKRTEAGAVANRGSRAEGAGIEEVVDAAGNRARGLNVRHGFAGAKAGADGAEGTAEAVDGASARIRESDRGAGLHDDNAGSSPATQYAASHALIVLEVGQIPEIVGDEAVARVVIRGAVTVPLM